MKHCVKFPDDKFLAVRPCLVSICFGNRPAAKLLGALLYRYNLRVENKEDAENQNAVKAANGNQPDQDTSYRIFRRQAQLVDDMCGEMTEKTLHDVAVPMLQVMGYLDLEEYMQSNCYIVNIEQVQQALNLYSPTSKDQTQLEKFLIKGMQLEKFLITSDELEKFLIDKKNFQSGLEKVLIWNRNTSNCRRGRKSNGQARSKGKIRTPKNIKEESKKDKEEEDTEQPQSDPTNEASATPSTPTLENTEYLPDLTSTEQDSYSPVPPVSGYEKKEEDEDVRGSDRTGPTPGAEVSASPAPVVPQTRNTTHGGQTRQSTATTRQGKGTTGNAQPEQTTLLVEKKPMTLEAQIDAAFQVLEHVKKQATGKPFGYVYTGAAKDSLKDLIKACKDTPNEINTANITLAWMAMWDSPRWSNGMSWQDPGKLTIAAFCRNYGEYLDKGRQAQEKPGETTEQPPSDEDAEREARNKRNKERSRKGAIAALQARIERNGKFQLYELKLMVEQFGMTLPPHLFSQYQASIPVHAQ